MRVLIVGGGYLGTKVQAALGAVAGMSATISSSRQQAGRVHVDLLDPSTFSAFAGYDVIVNASDAIHVSPLAAALYCLGEGLTFFESSAHPRTIEQLLALRRDHAQAKGLLLVGMGIFPGVSNLLARRLDADGKAQRLELAVRLNALSGGGHGMVSQMIDALFEPAIRYEKGERTVDQSVAAGISFPYADGPFPTLAIGLPEAVMFHVSLGVPNTATYLALRPRLFMLGVRLIAFLGTRLGKTIGKLMRWSMRLSLLTIRRVLFRGRPTPVELGLIADRHGSQRPDGRVLIARCSDGVRAGAEAIAAACRYLDAQPKKPSGVLTADEAFGADFWPYLENVVALVGESAAPRVLSPPAPSAGGEPDRAG